MDKKHSPAVMAILAKISPKKPDAEEADEPKERQRMAQEIMDAIEKKDAAALGDALESFFMYMDSQPHEEGEHTNDGK